MTDSSKRLSHLNSRFPTLLGIGDVNAQRAFKIGRLLLVCLIVQPFSFADAQDLFRAPRIPNSQTLGDHAVGSLNGNRFGLSPHLTSAQSVDVGVPQIGRPADFVTPADANSRPREDDFELGGFPAQTDSIGLETIEGIEQDARSGDQQSPAGSEQEQRHRSQRPISGREQIIQRYPDGKPQIVREVVQDSNGNFVNDGFWKVLARKGENTVIAEGQYKLGVMHGVWQRQHTSESSGLFATQPFSLFESPFASMATFNEGKLAGMWTLADAYERKIFEIPYRAGQRHGTATWWYPTMNKMREVTFKDGLLDGHLREWDEQSKLTRDEEFINGQKVIRNVTFYRPKQKESENFFLDAKLKVDGEDNWWDALPAPMVTDGTRLQHGPAVAWYENGLPKMKGQYADGERIGRFTWWHSNGNKQLEGAYDKDLKIGRWTWWHENGMQAIAGQYDGNQAVNVWRWWTPDGKLESEEDLSATHSKALETEQSKADLDTNLNSIKSGDLENPEVLPDGEPELILPMEADQTPSLDLNDFEGAKPSQKSGENLSELSGEQSANDDSDSLPENFFSDN